MRQVVAGELDFHIFSDKTSSLLLGSRDGSTEHKSLNIVTILEKCNARYPRIVELYAMLSESAHPNYEGTSIGYSDIDRTTHTVTFSNKWNAMHGKGHMDMMALCIQVFFGEYNEEWLGAIEELEEWIERNDSSLEHTKPPPSSKNY
jgi:hypothetical protein